MKSWLLGMLLLSLFSACSPRKVPDQEAPEAKGTAAVADPNREVPPNPVEEINADGFIVTHAISLRSTPKYPDGFTHFEYVNPEAPKGGTIVMAGTGTFDSFHRYARRGDSAPGAERFYDTLLTQSEDEIEVYYGLIAQKMEYSPDYTWIIFHLRPEARHQDGRPIVAEDVVFSFNKFLREGVPQFRTYYETVSSVEALDEGRVKFSLSEGSKDILISLGGTPVLPPQFWEGKDFTEPLLEPPMGSGAYVVSDYAMGQYVEYERLRDYWAMDIPVIKGTLNFEYIRYDMYRDEVVKLEALKAGEIDLRIENVAKQWATQYTGPNFDAGYIIKEELPDDTPPPIQRFVFNTQKEQISDRRVRQALSYMMDFEWLNKNLFYNQYSRTRSYFQGTPFEAFGIPSSEEMEIIESVRGQIPPEVFTREFQPSVSDGSGNVREQMAKAINLLSEAGWILKDQKMVNADSGAPLELELIMVSPVSERIAIPFQENLKKIGVDLQLRLIDTTQYINRIRKLDYDMASRPSGGSFYPDSSLQLAWHSEFIDSTYNASGVTDPVIDYLIEGIVANQNNNAELLNWGRALDRVLQWNYYGIFQWHAPTTRVAYWDKFSRPAIKPKYSDGLNTWWIDPAKESRL